ncbi:MAG: 1-acyl-sn-glycerol-3-phosphate acyltransferase [Cyanobacteria bacterium TGS_CYA1]|nr:1-acyl-sn-glycerol-3-phosphate acyltransferase [Cyanobacteria bacterium TGS_CYA1]
MLDFVKPRTSFPLLTLVKMLWPFYVLFKYGKLHIDLSDEVDETFERLKRKTVVICPNHSHKLDPDVMFALSRRVRQNFNFLAAREIFGSYKSRKYRWMQKLGCFSIERGAADIQSIKAIHEVLTEDENKLVIFPEGEVSHQNDYLMNLEDGVERMALTACKDLKKEDPNKTLYILPVILKYRFSQNIWPEILQTLSRVEAHLEIQVAPDTSVSARIRNCLLKGLDRLETRHNVTKRANDLEERLSNLRERLIEISKEYLKVELSSNLGQVSQLHVLRNSFAFNQFADGSNLELSPEDRVHYEELRLATHTVAIGEHSFKENLTQENAAELVNLLEEAITGKITLRLPDIAEIGVAKEIDVSEFLKEFETKKSKGVQALKIELSTRMKQRNIEFGKTRV